MMPDHEVVSLLRSPWADSLSRLVSQVDEHLLIASPFVNRSATGRILTQLDERGLRESVRVGLITDLRPESALAGSIDLDALTQLGQSLPKFELTHLPSVHAKVYVADSKLAIITSGNLTDAGLCRNVEYGVALVGKDIVARVRSDFQGYALLGAQVSVDEIAALTTRMKDLKEAFQRAERSVQAQALRAFKEKLESAQLQLLRHRARGKTTHAIFSDTIKFLLARGPLRTEELHPLVQLLHPDLCNDSVDRIIDGVHFGKRWKHYVRNAQQYLKRHGEVQFDGVRWRFTTPVESPH